MKNSMNSSAQQPMIVKYLESLHNGIQSQILSRYAIGYIYNRQIHLYSFFNSDVQKMFFWPIKKHLKIV